VGVNRDGDWRGERGREGEAERERGGRGLILNSESIVTMMMMIYM
jgi:hypothetical protein